MLKKDIEDTISKTMAFQNHDEARRPDNPKTLFDGKIPTLEKGIYRDASPMLQERFENYGRWVNATHGIWLSIQDMENLWCDDIEDSTVDRIKYHAECLKEDWPNHAYSLFKDNRLSLFAGSDIGNESIFLLWLDFEDEPELWVYDSNGESRYKNFNEYLIAYLNDDLSASEHSWRA